MGLASVVKGAPQGVWRYELYVERKGCSPDGQVLTVCCCVLGDVVGDSQNAKRQQLIGPKFFPLERLLAIVFSLLTIHDCEESARDANTADLFSEVRVPQGAAVWHTSSHVNIARPPVWRR